MEGLWTFRTRHLLARKISTDNRLMMAKSLGVHTPIPESTQTGWIRVGKRGQTNLKQYSPPVETTSAAVQDCGKPAWSRWWSSRLASNKNNVKVDDSPIEIIDDLPIFIQELMIYLFKLDYQRHPVILRPTPPEVVWPVSWRLKATWRSIRSDINVTVFFL